MWLPLRHAYGFDQPLPVQYERYMGGVVRGDFGQSLRLRDSVTHLVLARYPYTLALALAALLLGVAAAVPAGVWAATHRDRWQDRTVGVVSLVGLSFPNFALGPLLILGFSIGLGWLPVSGSGTGWGSWTHLVLPAVTLGSGLAAILDADGAHGDARGAGAGLHSHGAGEGFDRAARGCTGMR